MMIETLRSLFTRDLKRLRSELELYSKEENIWKTSGAIANTAGNLCLHLVGNLNTYVGKEIGGTGYVRDREAEFSTKQVSRLELLTKVDDTLGVVDKALAQLEEPDLMNEYPVLVFGEKTTTGYMLVHLATHLAYHTGQINYHRRLIDL